MKNKFILSSILISVLWVSCQKSENTTTGNPMVALAITSSPANATVVRNKTPIWDLLIPKSYAYQPPNLLVDAAGNSVTINSIWINFSQIEFKYDEIASGSEVDGDSIEFDGIYAVDLLSNTPQPFVSGYLSTSNMRRVKLKLAKNSSLASGAPSGFLGKSIFVSGTVNGNNFTYSTEDETVIEIAGPTLVSAVENRTLLIELQIANLIKKTNLSGISTTTNINDTNRISATNPCANIENGAADLFTCFYKGFEKESNLGRDDDGDFILDAEEDKVKN